jgi:hypothetical protein
VRAAEILLEKFPRQKEVSGILSNTSIRMGFECEGIIETPHYNRIANSIIDDYGLEPEDEDYDQVLSSAVEDEIGFSMRSMVAQKISSAFNVNCVVYKNDTPNTVPTPMHNRGFMDYSKWGVVMDGSLRGEGVPIEIVSPVYSVGEGLAKLDQTFRFMAKNGITTNSTTGLHVTMSIKEKSARDFDFLKMAIFYDETNVIKQFNREDNDYCQLLRDKMQNLIGKNFSDLTKNKKEIGQILDILQRAGDSFRFELETHKYFTIRPKPNGLFEFRAIGGSNYEYRYPDIHKNILAMANIMLIGSDRTLYAEEYVKKVFDMLNNGKYHPDVDGIRKVISDKKMKIAPQQAAAIKQAIEDEKIAHKFNRNDAVDTFIRGIITSTSI